MAFSPTRATPSSGNSMALMKRESTPLAIRAPTGHPSASRGSSSSSPQDSASTSPAFSSQDPQTPGEPRQAFLPTHTANLKHAPRNSQFAASPAKQRTAHTASAVQLAPLAPAAAAATSAPVSPERSMRHPQNSFRQVHRRSLEVRAPKLPAMVEA